MVGVGGSWIQQRSKIGSDRSQLEKRLAAEENRLDRQLKHDRDVAELEALRAVLDEAGDALSKGRLAINRISNLWRQGLPSQDPAKVDAETEHRQMVKVIDSAQSRLDLRLPADHPVLRAYEEASLALDKINWFLKEEAEQENYADHESVLSQGIERFEECVSAFLLSAQRQFGPKGAFVQSP